MSSILSSISDITSTIYSANNTGSGSYGNPTETIERVFSNLDREGKGYLDASDFQTAFESLGLGGDDGADDSLTSAGVEQVVSVLDVDGDGRVTSDDMTEGLQALTDSLGVLRGRDAGGDSAAGAGMPMPPTPQEVLGFTEEELLSQYDDLTASGDADPEDQGNQLLAGILNDFDTADADGDGRVSGEEAMAFAQTLSAPESMLDEAVEEASVAGDIATSATTDSVSAEEASNELLVMRRIMALVDTYGTSSTSGDASDDLLSELA